MHVNVTPASRKRQWHIDKVNNATTPADQMDCAISWARAELAQCASARPEDAPGLRRQLAHMIAMFAADIHRVHPAPEFRDSLPPLPGGGWAPKPRSDARHP